MLSQNQLMSAIIKYLIEGLAVAFVAYYIPKTKTNMNEILLIAMVSSISLLILDLFAPTVATGARLGSGFKIGTGMVKESFNGKCPNNIRDVGLSYIKKYGGPVLVRKDLTDQQKKHLIFQNMKTHMDNLNPPLTKSQLNNHAYVAKRLGLC